MECPPEPVPERSDAANGADPIKITDALIDSTNISLIFARLGTSIKEFPIGTHTRHLQKPKEEEDEAS
jgi:hypothetical protein